MIWLRNLPPPRDKFLYKSETNLATTKKFAKKNRKRGQDINNKNMKKHA
jgi:hypothetical protein